MICKSCRDGSHTQCKETVCDCQHRTPIYRQMVAEAALRETERIINEQGK